MIILFLSPVNCGISNKVSVLNEYFMMEAVNTKCSGELNLQGGKEIYIVFWKQRTTVGDFDMRLHC